MKKKKRKSEKNKSREKGFRKHFSFRKTQTNSGRDTSFLLAIILASSNKVDKKENNNYFVRTLTKIKCFYTQCLIQ